MSPPILTPEQVAEHVVTKRYRLAPPETIAAGDLLVSLHPDSVAWADYVEGRLILFDIFCEDPIDRFERLTGRRLDQTNESDLDEAL